MSLPDDAPHPIPRVQFALFVTGDNGEPLEKLIQDLEDQQVFTLGVLPAAVAAAQATADAALALLVPFVPVNHGGTGLTGGTSGGILAFVGPTTIASSALLAQHGIVLGGGVGAVPSTPVALGTAGYVLTSQGAGVDPIFAAVPGVASAALTKADDTNVTLTLGGTPGAALLAATSITVGWAGTLAVTRGGTGLATLTAHALYVGNGAVAPTALAVGATNTVLHGNTGANPSFSAVVEADITLANNTTNDVSITKHGFAPKAPNDATKYLDGTGAYSTPAGAGATTPTQQVLTAGVLYTRPAGCKQIRVCAQAAGGGGAGASSDGTATAGGNGGNTTFNGVTATGGTGGTPSVGGTSGGTGGAGAANFRIAGAPGGVPSKFVFSATNEISAGGNGGGNGGGVGSNVGGTGGTAPGAGGAGGGLGSVVIGNYSLGPGGGQGEFFELIITTPAATYAFAIGAAGTAGAAGTNGFAGAAGAAGRIIVYESY